MFCTYIWWMWENFAAVLIVCNIPSLILMLTLKWKCYTLSAQTITNSVHFCGREADSIKQYHD